MVASAIRVIENTGEKFYARHYGRQLLGIYIVPSSVRPFKFHRASG